MLYATHLFPRDYFHIGYEMIVVIIVEVIDARTKASDAERWCFLLSAWINGWVNNGEAGDLRRHRAHYDVTVITYCFVSHTNVGS